MGYVVGAIWVAIANTFDIPGWAVILFIIVGCILNYFIQEKTADPITPEEAFLDECGYTKEEMTPERREEARKILESRHAK